MSPSLNTSSPEGQRINNFFSNDGSQARGSFMGITPKNNGITSYQKQGLSRGPLPSERLSAPGNTLLYSAGQRPKHNGKNSSSSSGNAYSARPASALLRSAANGRPASALYGNSRTSPANSFRSEARDQGILKSGCRHVHAMSMTSNRDKESLAEEWHQLMCALDPTHPEYVQTPIAKDVDPYTLAYAILLMREGIFSHNSGGKVWKSCHCCNDARSIDSDLLADLLGGALQRIKEGGRMRPASATPNFRDMTDDDKVALLTRIYGGKFQRGRTSSGRSRLYDHLDIGRHLDLLLVAEEDEEEHIPEADESFSKEWDEQEEEEQEEEQEEEEPEPAQDEGTNTVEVVAEVQTDAVQTEAVKPNVLDQDTQTIDPEMQPEATQWDPVDFDGQETEAAKLARLGFPGIGADTAAMFADAAGKTLAAMMELAQGVKAGPDASQAAALSLAAAVMAPGAGLAGGAAEKVAAGEKPADGTEGETASDVASAGTELPDVHQQQMATLDDVEASLNDLQRKLDARLEDAELAGCDDLEFPMFGGNHSWTDIRNMQHRSMTQGAPIQFTSSIPTYVPVSENIRGLLERLRGLGTADQSLDTTASPSGDASDDPAVFVVGLCGKPGDVAKKPPPRKRVSKRVPEHADDEVARAMKKGPGHHSRTTPYEQNRKGIKQEHARKKQAARRRQQQQDQQDQQGSWLEAVKQYLFDPTASLAPPQLDDAMKALEEVQKRLANPENRIDADIDAILSGNAPSNPTSGDPLAGSGLPSLNPLLQQLQEASSQLICSFASAAAAALHPSDAAAENPAASFNQALRNAAMGAAQVKRLLHVLADTACLSERLLTVQPRPAGSTPALDLIHDLALAAETRGNALLSHLSPALHALQTLAQIWKPNGSSTEKSKEAMVQLRKVFEHLHGSCHDLLAEFRNVKEVQYKGSKPLGLQDGLSGSGVDTICAMTAHLSSLVHALDWLYGPIEGGGAKADNTASLQPQKDGNAAGAVSAQDGVKRDQQEEDGNEQSLEAASRTTETAAIASAESEEATGKVVHAAALLPVLQGYLLNVEALLNCWSNSYGTAWDVTRAHAMHEVRQNSGMPSYQEMLQQLQEAKEKLEEATAQLAATEAEKKALSESLEEAEGKVKELQAKLQEAEQKLEAAVAEADKANKALADKALPEGAMSPEDADKIRKELSALQAEVVSLKAKLAETERKLEESTKKVAEVQAALQAEKDKPAPPVVEKGCCGC